MKSLNIVFTEKQKAELVEQKLPDMTSTSALVKTVVSLISTGTELACFRGEFDKDTNWADWVKYPFRPGYSTVGEIVEVGKDISDFKIGDMLILSQPHSQYHIIDLVKGADGHSIVRLPDGISPEQATCLTMADIAAAGVRRAKIEYGERVVVVGAGPVGQMTAQLSLVSGALKVIVIDTVQKRLDSAKAYGATDILKMTSSQAIEELKELLDGDKPEVVFDVTGHHSVLADCCKMVKNYGRVVLLGDSTQPSKQGIGPALFKSVSILGIHGMKYYDIESLPWSAERHKKILFELLLQKRLKTDHLISHRFSPDEAGKLYPKLLTNREFSMNVVLDWNKL